MFLDADECLAIILLLECYPQDPVAYHFLGVELAYNLMMASSVLLDHHCNATFQIGNM